MAVTGISHTNTTGKVKEFAAIVRVNERAFRSVCDEVEDTRQSRGHVLKIFLIELVGHGFPCSTKPGG
jgi:hypothetical protein